MPIILVSLEAKIGKIKVHSHPREKVRETPSQQQSWPWWSISVILAVWEHRLKNHNPRPALDNKAGYLT
jgi:hypothetical protein